MSVIVKTMKMPNSCASCPLLAYDDFATGHEYKCTALREFMGVDELPVGRREDCPLVEEEPVKRGKWIETDEWDEFSGRLYKCSNCKTFVIGDIDNYCPYCGARMDEE